MLFRRFSTTTTAPHTAVGAMPAGDMALIVHGWDIAATAMAMDTGHGVTSHGVAHGVIDSKQKLKPSKVLRPRAGTLGGFLFLGWCVRLLA
jgi:hypothetical protein